MPLTHLGRHAVLAPTPARTTGEPPKGEKTNTPQGEAQRGCGLYALGPRSPQGKSLWGVEGHWATTPSYYTPALWVESHCLFHHASCEE